MLYLVRAMLTCHARHVPHHTAALHMDYLAPDNATAMQLQVPDYPNPSLIANSANLLCRPNSQAYTPQKWGSIPITSPLPRCPAAFPSPCISTVSETVNYPCADHPIILLSLPN